jgi:hypothetical protein
MFHHTDKVSLKYILLADARTQLAFPAKSRKFQATKEMRKMQERMMEQYNIKTGKKL